MSFNSIIGQKKALECISRILKSQRIPPGLLFYGPEGVGKSLTAGELSKILNCTDLQNFNYCGKCVNCVNAARGIHPDIIRADFNFQAQLLELPLEKQQHIRIETIRYLCEKAQQKPIIGKWKIFIIAEAQTMLAGAANALLKLLEEPPDNTVWILISSRRDSLLPTIRSRCQSVAFGTLSVEEVEEILVEKSITMKTSQTLAQISSGSVDKALKIYELSKDMQDIDAMDTLYPFHIAKKLPREFGPARKNAKAIIGLLIESVYEKWKNENRQEAKDVLKNVIEKLFAHIAFINRNVSPHSVIEVAMLETAHLNLDVFPKITLEENLF